MGIMMEQSKIWHFSAEMPVFRMWLDERLSAFIIYCDNFAHELFSVFLVQLDRITGCILSDAHMCWSFWRTHWIWSVACQVGYYRQGMEVHMHRLNNMKKCMCYCFHGYYSL